MARQFNGADSVGTNTKGNASEDNFSAFALFKPDGNAGGFLMHNGHGNDSGAGWGMGVSGTTHQFTADIAFVAAYNTGLFSRLKRWNRGVIIRRSGTWHAFLNGKKSSVVITNAPFSISDRYYIGARSNSSGTLGSFFRGGIKRVSLWARAISDQEGMALSKGTIQPHQIPLSLSQDHILNGNGSTEPAFRVGLTLTVVGAVLTGNPSPIYRFFADLWRLAKKGGTAFTTELTETITLVDTVTKLTGKVLTDVVTLVDTIIRATQRTLTEVVTVVDTIVRTASKVLTDRIRASDGQYRISLNGTTDYVDLGSNTIIDIPSSGAFTIEGKFKTTDTAGPIVSFRSSTDDGVVIDICVGYDGAITDNGKLMALLRQDAGTAGYARITGGVVNDGAVHRFALTRTAGSTIQLWLDGVSQGTNSAAESGGALTTNMRNIGREPRWVQLGSNTAAQRFLSAEVERVRVYTRKVTDAEIGEFNTDTFTDNTSLKQAINFREGSGTTSFDTSGNYLEATINGGTWVLVRGVIKSLSRTLTDVVALVDTIVKSTARTFVEAVVVVDTIVRQGQKVLTEVVTVVDSVIKSTARTLTEAVTMVDSVVKSTARTLTDPVVLVDTIVRSFNRTLSEVVTLVDTLVRQTSRTLTEAITVVDTVIKSTGKVLSEVVTLSDTILRAIERTFTETVTLVDTVLKQLSKTFTEAVTLTDTFTYRLITKMRKGATILLTTADKAVTLLKKAGRSIL